MVPQRVFLVDEVVDQLRERILAGEYPPGSRLRQEQVAAELGLSRTPVREAMRTLEREHLLVVERSGGMRVAESDPGTLLAAYELREVVDGLAARLAAARGATDVADQLDEVLLQQESLLAGQWSPERWVRSNTRFHGLVMEASNNPYLLGLVPFVQATSRVFRPVSVLGRDRATEAHGEHAAISAALLAGQVEQAESLARAHIRRTSDALARQLATHHQQSTHDASPV